MKLRVLLPLAASLLLCAGLPATGDDKTGDDKKELDKLQGEWTLVSREAKGKKSDETAKNYKLTIKGDQWILNPGPTATITIDASKDPKWIDLTKFAPGIYQLEGDTLTICRPTSGTGRPKEFKATKDGANAVIVYKRTSK